MVRRGRGVVSQCILGLGGYPLTQEDNVQIAEAQRILHKATRVYQCTAQLKQALRMRDYDALTAAKKAALELGIQVRPCRIPWKIRVD